MKITGLLGLSHKGPTLPKSSPFYPGLKPLAWTIFFVVLVAELIGAYIIVYQGNHVLTDAMARTANAYYVLHLQPNKLASIGFVWNPLPSLLQIPILAFTGWWRPLATHGVAGSIITALFAATNAALLFRYFRMWSTRNWFPLLVACLYAFNPFIFYYGLNGMSETLFFTSMIIGIYQFSFWMEDRMNHRLLWVALMLAMGFLVRYEVLTLMLAFACALFVAIFLMEDKKSPFKKKPSTMQLHYSISTYLVVFMPVLYVIGVWIITCWAIMGDPFHFLHSAYSNESQTAVGLLASPRFSESAHPYIDPMIFTIVHSLPFLLPVFVILIERLLTWRLFRADMLVFILMAGCFFGFHYVLLLTGKSFGWLRFYSYSLPISMAWFPYELTTLKKWPRILTSVGFCISLIISAAMIPYYFADRELAGEEYTSFYHTEDVGFGPQLEVAQWINEKYNDKTVLLDSFIASALIMNLDHPEKIVTTASDEFMDAVKDPHGNSIDYIVVPSPRGVGALDAINREYPDLYYYGVPAWVELAESNDSFRMYQVVPIKEPDADNEETDEEGELPLDEPGSDGAELP